MNIKEEILKESLRYKGTMFWENYMLSNIVRTVSRDLKKYEDPDIVVEMYSIIYGEESVELFEDMVNDEESLHEAANIDEEYLLFELAGTAMKMGKGVPLGILGGRFLRGLWSKFKGLFSSGTFATIGAFLKSGFSWAKNLVKQGAEWVSNTPIVNVAVPMLMVFGGLKVAKAAINKMRRKTGKKKMSKEEEEQFDEIAAKNKDKVEQTRQKVLNKEAA